MADGGLTPNRALTRRALGLSLLALAAFAAVAVPTAYHGEAIVMAIEKSRTMARGTRYESQGKYRVARVEYRRLLEISPESHDARARLVRLLLHDARHGEAIVHAEIIVEHSGGAAEQSLYGDALLAAGNAAQAAIAYDKALASQPGYPDALYGAALAKAIEGDTAHFRKRIEALSGADRLQASEHYRSAMDAVAGLEERWTKRGHLTAAPPRQVALLVDALLRRGKWKRAREARRQAMTADTWQDVRGSAKMALDIHAKANR